MSSEFIAHISYKTNHSSPLRFNLSHIVRHPLVGVLLIIGVFRNAALAAAVPSFVGLASDAVIQACDLRYLSGSTSSTRVGVSSFPPAWRRKCAPVLCGGTPALPGGWKGPTG